MLVPSSSESKQSATPDLMLALSRSQAARALSVSTDFFDDHIAPEVKSVRRGRRSLYPVDELQRWLFENARLEAA
jgi:hypothetical protein